MKRGKELLSICLIYLLILSLADLAVAGTGVFIDSGQLLGDSPSYKVSLGDLDGDEDLDAFIANFTHPNKVWLNNGSGIFTDSGQNLGVGSLYSTGSALGDLDNDGDLDAFVATYAEPSVVWLNNGSGIFTDSGQRLGGLSESASVVLGDLDNDGDLDAFEQYTAGYSKVWLNNGSGIFTDSGQNTWGASALGDFDGDGDLDAFVVRTNGANRVWINDGSSIFTDSGQLLGSQDSIGVALGDVDGDGDLDAFVANSAQPGTNRVGVDRVWINDGSGIFADSGQALGGDDTSRSVALGDFDGDGDLDAFVANEFHSNKIYLNNGMGIFTDSGQALGLRDSRSVALGDLDGDGDLDAFVAMGSYQPNKVWLNDGTELNEPPVAYAGDNFTIYSQDQVSTVIIGTASDPDEDTLTYRWIEGTTELSAWQDVDANGEVYLDLSLVPYFDIGEHTLTLEVSDGEVISTDDMILTINNSAPNPAPTGGGTYEINDEVILGGQVADFDGDILSCEWFEDSYQLFFDEVQSISGGDAVSLPEHSISNLSLGTHTITLSVNDGVNQTTSSDITVVIQDTQDPTLAPECDKTILWPPNHQMVDITIQANAYDNSGARAMIDATVVSNEPEDGLGDGDMSPDWEIVAVDQTKGEISLRLRAERSGNGNGRAYTVIITCTDEAGNSTSANVEIIVPHNRKK